MTKLVLRELASPAEFGETVDIAKAAWRFSERSLSPAGDLIAATHAGGLTAGAFEGDRMLGFVHGFPRTNLGQACQHSHLLAVLPGAQGRGLSVLLKLYQRRWCLERDIRIVTWTYDPFLVKNARLNIGKLRAVARAYLPDFYGPMGGIYGELPTDRFEILWRLDDPVVERAAAGDEPIPPDLTDVPIFSSRKPTYAARVTLRFPADAPVIYRTDPKGSFKARLAFRRSATSLFERGYEATAVVVGSGEPMYLFERR